jgi:NADPH:quinone reductase-like Zn-dependent oxidoreductase
MSSIPATQRAWVIERRGRPANALKLSSDWEVPTKLKEGEVLVKIQAAALNPVSVRLASIYPLM